MMQTYTLTLCTHGGQIIDMHQVYKHIKEISGTIGAGLRTIQRII